ncbi:MAG: DUF4270 domain-containing protein [Bacteroidota bacterium]
MNTTLTKLPAILLTGFLLILALYSCNKDPYQIGLDLLPPSDTLNIKSSDTSTVQAFSVLQDSIRTDKPGSLYMGSMSDPVFGKVTSNIYTQLRLVSEGVDFGTHPILDSLVLVLFYKGYYGDTLTQQNVKVYEISEDFSYDSIYYSNKRLATYPTLLADMDFKPRVKDSVKVYTTKLSPHLRINLSKLTNYLGNKILSAPASELATNTAFIKYMKGLYIKTTPVSSGGALLNILTTNGVSKMVAYYHNGNDPKDDSLHYDILIDESCARFTHLDHNRYLEAGTDLKQQILNHDSLRGSRQLYLQGMAGVKVKVKFPFMKNFGRGKKIAINEAILELKNSETDTTFAPPPTISMLRQDSVGRIAYMVDYSEGSGYFGGIYNKTTRSYYFRLTQYMQKVLQNAYTNHYDLYILVDNPITSIPTPNRILINGTNPLDPRDLSNRLRLKVTYTILH